MSHSFLQERASPLTKAFQLCRKCATSCVCILPVNHVNMSKQQLRGWSWLQVTRCARFSRDRPRMWCFVPWIPASPRHGTSCDLWFFISRPQELHRACKRGCIALKPCVKGSVRFSCLFVTGCCKSGAQIFSLTSDQCHIRWFWFSVLLLSKTCKTRWLANECNYWNVKNNNNRNVNIYFILKLF